VGRIVEANPANRCEILPEPARRKVTAVTAIAAREKYPPSELRSLHQIAPVSAGRGSAVQLPASLPDRSSDVAILVQTEPRAEPRQKGAAFRLFGLACAGLLIWGAFVRD
jgi:hypothetical protein